MPKDLLSALLMDLEQQQFKEQEGLKIFLRWLVQEVYFRKDGLGDTNTHRYITNQKSNGNDPKTELESLVYHSDKYLKYDDLINAVTNKVFDVYLEKRENDINSFDDVMLKTLCCYESKFNKYDKNSVIDFASIILNDYFVRKNIKAFSSKNKTREYVLKNGESNILNEIANRIKKTGSIDDMINDYSIMIAESFLSINNEFSNIDNLKNKLTKCVLNLNMNDRQKQYLLSELEIGNVDALYGYVPQELINEYKQALSAEEKKYSI